jgi:hypothetical protein
MSDRYVMDTAVVTLGNMSSALKRYPDSVDARRHRANADVAASSRARPVADPDPARSRPAAHRERVQAEVAAPLTRSVRSPHADRLTARQEPRNRRVRLADITVGYDGLNRAAQQLRQGRGEVDSELKRLQVLIDQLTQGGFKT